ACSRRPLAYRTVVGSPWGSRLRRRSDTWRHGGRAARRPDRRGVPRGTGPAPRLRAGRAELVPSLSTRPAPQDRIDHALDRRTDLQKRTLKVDEARKDPTSNPTFSATTRNAL